MTGGRWRINLQTGEALRLPMLGKDEQETRIAELEHALKVARWNEGEAKRIADQAVSNMRRFWEEDTAALRRVQALRWRYAGRKTLPLADLESALAPLFTDKGVEHG